MIVQIETSDAEKSVRFYVGLPESKGNLSLSITP